ncbi:hypothetical protein GCM10023093_11540 [Nemorincola caseinilytica]|uniref:Carboxypeptidase regulatory-like domain-containing protein n=1 Tax=Nemorincola caseinilytica TaxID=2054315 RepID=A0ABP8NC20_9BACT
MQRPQTIQLHIADPCHEDWNKMTPCAQGRHCTQCDKTVIDFTSWSDAALYEFFSKDPGNVCGNFNVWQLGRDISIPPQPHSRLYRMVVAMGLTLIFAQGTDVYAQSGRPPVTQSADKGDAYRLRMSKYSIGMFRGTVTDERGIALPGAWVQVIHEGAIKDQTMTGLHGEYMIRSLPPGIYEANFMYAGQCKAKVINIDIDEDVVSQNVCINTGNARLQVIHNQKEPVIRKYESEQILNPPMYSRRGGVSPYYKMNGARTCGVIDIKDELEIPEEARKAAGMPEKDSLLEPNRKIYNMDDVQKMHMR